MFKVYTSADGLAHNRVYRIVIDKKGFLWFCTLDGLSRFDGQHFVSFGTNNGAPFGTVTDLVELPGGNYWIASRGQGIIRFAAEGHVEPVTAATLKARFKPYKISDEPSSNYAYALHLDRSGTVWIGTRAGLYKLTENRGSVRIDPVPLLLPGHSDRQLQILSLTEDPEGSIYAAISFGVVRLLPDGRRIFYRVLEPDDDPSIGTVLFHDGVLWYGHRTGLFLLRPPPAAHSGLAIQIDDALSRAAKVSIASGLQPSSKPGEAVFYRLDKDPAKSYVFAVHEFRDGRVWLASQAGTFEYNQGHFRRVLPNAPFNYALAIGEDAAGNAWVSTDYAGVAKVESRGFVKLDQHDGIGSVPQGTLIDSFGEVLIESWPRRLVTTGERLRTIELKLASDAVFTPGRPVLQDDTGEWWVGTSEGLYRFPKVAKTSDLANVAPKAVFTRAEGLADDKVCDPFEDSTGDIWVGGFDSPEPAISRWERRTGRIYRYSVQEGLPAGGGNLMGIVEDFRHDLWFAFSEGGLARYRNGKFTSFLEAQGLTSRKIGGIVTDTNGRVWCSIIDAGLARIEDSSGQRLKLKTYSVTQPLRNYLFYGAPVFADAQGRIYAGLPHGVDRLDPLTGSVTHYGQADGVPDGPLIVIQADSKGAIWISARKSVVRLLPDTERKTAPSPVLISGVRISGIDYQVPATGARSLSLNELPYQKNSFQIDFLSLFTAGQRPLFQYKLDGANSTWSAPTPEGTVNYANLTPGDYRFQVRVAGLSDYSAVTPAQLTFRILPPFWKRAWFIACMVCAGLTLFVAFERYRATKMEQLKSAMIALRTANEERIAEIERVRRRIATDLHDDIGSSLTQISVLSEVARQQIENSSTLDRPLGIIAGSARELVDSMSDIVWAINPQRDHLSDLIHRMRRFTADMLTARNIQFTMELPASAGDDMKLEGNLRREIFLIFKEALNNAVRHSACTFAEIALRVEENTLLLHVRDNGRGFDILGASEGHGLASMSSRASELGGRFHIASKPGEGSQVSFELPLRTT